MILETLWTKVRGWVAPFVVSLIGSLAVALVVLGLAYKSEIAKTAKLEEDVATLDATVIALKEGIQIEKQKLYVLAQQRQESNQKFNDVKRELLQYKGREDVIAEKPELVRGMIQQSFDSFVNEVNCITGDKSQCGK